MKSHLLKFALALVLCTLLTPTPAKAQEDDCGVNCQSCLIFGSEGYNYNAQGGYNMTCHFGSSCAKCADSRVGSGADAETLLTLIKSGKESDVRKAIHSNRDRLLIVPSRGLVAVRGTKCDPNGLVAVVYIGRDRVGLLKKAGLAQLPPASRTE